MGWVKDTFFGGAEKDAAKQQIAAGDRAMATQKEYYNQARNDIMQLFPQAYQGLQTSYQQAIDQIGAGKASAADILKQAFNQSNQIQQSGSNAAISALLGRPQQMQLPQAMPQPVAQTMQSKNMFQTGVAPTGLRGGQVMQTNQMMQPGQVGVLGGGYSTGMKSPDGGQFENFGGASPQQMMQTGATGTAGMSNPNAPTMTTGQGFNAPLAQTQNLGATPQVQSNVDMSGIGLSGAESALNAGMQGQLNALQGGSQQAQGTLQQTLGGQLGSLRGGFGGAEEALNAYGSQALGAAQQGFNQGRGDLAGALGAAQGSIGQGVGLLANAQNQGLGRIDQSTGQAINYLNPYASTGQEAQQREAALSGALGGAAQQQAFQDFQESPGQKFLRERQEQALLRNASATGGLRGGSTLSALQEQASGIAAQQQQQQLENMRNIAQRGQQAATQQGQFSQTGGISGANLIGQIAGQQAGLLGQQAGLQANTGSQMANLAAQGGQFAGNTLNNLGSQVSGLRSGLGQLESGAIGNTGGNVANLQNQLGGNAANVFGNTSSNLAGLRSQAGQQVAGQLNNQTNQLSNNQLNLGQLLAGLDTGTASQLANLLTSGGAAGSQNQMNLAALLANLATGQGSNLSQIQIGQGNAQSGGTIGSAGGAREGLGASLGAVGSLIPGLFSDERLKDNITPLADGPVGLFAWTWKHIKEIPEQLRGAWSIGVIAQEVQDKFPECVVERNGFLAVDYAKLSQEVANV
jgi:hypothetical protein